MVRQMKVLKAVSRASLLGMTGAVLFVAAMTAFPVTAFAHGGNMDVNQVHACVQQNSNQVRIVGVNGSCSNSETAVHWSIVGPQGATGPAGPAGADGPMLLIAVIS